MKTQMAIILDFSDHTWDIFIFNNTLKIEKNIINLQTVQKLTPHKILPRCIVQPLLQILKVALMSATFSHSGVIQYVIGFSPWFC